MTTVTIDRWWANTLLFGVLIVGWTGLSIAVELAFWRDLTREPPLAAWITLLFGGAFLVSVIAFLIAYAAGRLASVARFGDDLQFSTLLDERHFAWSEVGRIVFKEMSMPLPSKFTVKFVATDGKRFDVYASARQAKELFALVEKKTLAADWPGQPLSAGTVWAILGLGLIAVATGLRLDMTLWQEWQNAPRAPGLGKASVLAMGIPLLGVVSIGFAAFHLLRRPIVVRPGVFRIKGAEAMTARALINQLFGRFD